jgi:tubulin--tyrosine ligase like protein 10
MQQIMQNVIHSIRFKLARKVGYFGIYGFDFMIDDDLNVWLIEANVNPAIATNTEALNKAIPPVIEETISLLIRSILH